MGSRGAFEDVDTGKFNFVENGQNYHTVGDVDGVQVILQNSGAVLRLLNIRTQQKEHMRLFRMES